MYPNNGGLFGIPADASTMYPQGNPQQQQMNSAMPNVMSRPNGGLQAPPPPVVDPNQQMIEAQAAQPLKYSIGDPIVDKYINRFLS